MNSTNTTIAKVLTPLFYFASGFIIAGACTALGYYALDREPEGMCLIIGIPILTVYYRLCPSPPPHERFSPLAKWVGWFLASALLGVLVGGLLRKLLLKLIATAAGPILGGMGGWLLGLVAFLLAQAAFPAAHPEDRKRRGASLMSYEEAKRRAADLRQPSQTPDTLPPNDRGEL